MKVARRSALSWQLRRRLRWQRPRVPARRQQLQPRRAVAAWAARLGCCPPLHTRHQPQPAQSEQGHPAPSSSSSSKRCPMGRPQPTSGPLLAAAGSALPTATLRTTGPPLLAVQQLLAARVSHRQSTTAPWLLTWRQQGPQMRPSPLPPTSPAACRRRARLPLQWLLWRPRRPHRMAACGRRRRRRLRSSWARSSKHWHARQAVLLWFASLGGSGGSWLYTVRATFWGVQPPGQQATIVSLLPARIQTATIYYLPAEWLRHPRQQRNRQRPRGHQPRCTRGCTLPGFCYIPWLYQCHM